MTLTPSECGRLSRQSQLKAHIDELTAKYQPKIIGQYQENGYTVTVYAPFYADGAVPITRIRMRDLCSI